MREQNSYKKWGEKKFLTKCEEWGRKICKSEVREPRPMWTPKTPKSELCHVLEKVLQSVSCHHMVQTARWSSSTPWLRSRACLLTSVPLSTTWFWGTWRKPSDFDVAYTVVEVFDRYDNALSVNHQSVKDEKQRVPTVVIIKSLAEGQCLHGGVVSLFQKTRPRWHSSSPTTLKQMQSWVAS